MPQETFGPDSWQARGHRIRELELELEAARDEIVKLRADIVWISKERDDNKRWAEDRAAVAIQMADQRDEARALLQTAKGTTS